ncbi:MAG: undecaprenyl-diphosphatase UppP [Candidatus Aminicenantes bacterium]|nr:undecaprenyl-diphosphatase UppP [Candidatus Aminicenantes bacterium]
MDNLLALLAGAVQGLTEFLPVSSSGHLVILHDVLGFDAFDNVLFDVVMHLATLAVLVVVFRREISRLFSGFWASLVHPAWKDDFEQRLPWLILAGSVPVAVTGFLFDTVIERTLRTLPVVAGALVLVGCLFIVAERFATQRRKMTSATWKDALAVGLAQAISLVPGVSRSGLTIVAGLGRGMKRDEAARFSFLLSVPAVLGAGLKKVLEVGDWSQADLVALGLGFAAAFVSGTIAIRSFLRFLGRHPLHVFAGYRFLLAAAVIVWLFVR